MKPFVFLLLTFAALASAADIGGTWKGTAETPNGAVERTFVFKVDGNKLTGETTTQMTGKSSINDGKIEGDAISFTMNIKIQDTELKMSYTGKVNGDQIKFHVVNEDMGLVMDYSVKKVS